jgi:hypothetical protein
MRPRRIRDTLVTSVAAAFCFAVAAGGAGEGLPHARSILRSDTFNYKGALARVAYELFKPPRGTILTITKAHDHFNPHEGVDFQKYEVADRKGEALGEFVRMRVHRGQDTTIDVALVLEDGKIAGAAAIRPTVIDKAPFLDFPDFLMGLSKYPIASYASGLAHVFRSLVYLERSSKAPSVAPLSSTAVLPPLWEMVRPVSESDTGRSAGPLRSSGLVIEMVAS